MDSSAEIHRWKQLLWDCLHRRADFLNLILRIKYKFTRKTEENTYSKEGGDPVQIGKGVVITGRTWEEGGVEAQTTGRSPS